MRLLLLLAGCGAAAAGPLRFTGSATLYGEYGWADGDSLVQPRPELRLCLRPTLSLWGFPLGLDILASTQENNLRQQLDRFRLFFNPGEWLRSRSDLSGLALSIRGFELGSCNPSWTQYTLAGAPLLGGAFELNPWYVYLAGAAGRAQRAVPVSDTTEGAYARMLYSGRFGFGKREGTHFFLTALYATDDTGSLANNMLPYPGDTVPPPDSFEVVQPRENYVLGAEFNLHAAGGAFTFHSEIAASEFTRDKRLAIQRWDEVPDWIEDAFRPRLSSSLDYAFRLSPAVSLFETRLSGRFEYVGPGFKSLGAPGLRSDNLAIGANLSRSFFDRRVAVAVGFSTERDNLLQVRVRDSTGNLAFVLPFKSRTSRYTRWDASLNLAFPDLPYVQAGFYPYAQAADSLDSFGRRVATTASQGSSASLGTGWFFRTGGVAHSPAVSASWGSLSGSGATGDYTSWEVLLNYGLDFAAPFSVSAGCGYGRTAPAGGPVDSRLTLDLSPGCTLFGKWANRLSLGATVGPSSRIDARFTSSFPVWKICDATVGAGSAVHSGDDGRYSDLRLSASLSRNW